MRHNDFPKSTGMLAGKVCASVLVALACQTTVFLTSCSNSKSTPPPPTITITATGGSGQSTTVNTAFAKPLVANVTSNGAAASGVTVTFSAPGSGASCALANASVTTDSNGNASTTCTANGTAGGPYNVTATTSGATTPASFSLTNNGVTISATSGTPQFVAINIAFAQPLVATVLDTNSNPVSGATVTFAAPGSGASCALASTSVTTDASGNASTTCTADGTAGDYTVTASVSGAPAPANFSLSNGVPYAFYVSGMEAPNSNNGNTKNYYAVAGAVLIDANGTVLGGEEDYNDGIGGITQTGLSITSGTLTASATGQGTLTVVTNNGTATQFVGVAGTETLGVQFVNTSHALIVQFDGTATSSGSMDQQTLTGASGNFAFTFSGQDTNGTPVAYGGVFSVANKTVSGIADVNDNGAVSTAQTFAGTTSGADAYGRGLTSGITINGAALMLNYYIVGPEALRLIDVDVPGTPGTGGAAVGSAFGQASSTTFSLGASVLGLEGDPAPLAFPYDTIGMLTTNPATLAFTGVVDDDERGSVKTATPIAGTYSTSTTVGGVAYNGYGNLTIAAPDPLVYVTTMGMYMTDPALNLSDPNNTTGGGGALLLDLDANLSGGTGVVIPQTGTASTSFTGDYDFGAQELFAQSGVISEFDFVGQGSVTTLALSGTGLVSDPFGYFAAGTGAEYSGATFAGTATADTTNTGRYTLPLGITTTGSTQTPQMAIYQASGGLLLWMGEDSSDTSFGSLQQQGSLTGLPAVRRPVVKGRRVNHRH